MRLSGMVEKNKIIEFTFDVKPIECGSQFLRSGHNDRSLGRNPRLGDTLNKQIQMENF